MREVHGEMGLRRRGPLQEGVERTGVVLELLLQLPDRVVDLARDVVALELGGVGAGLVAHLLLLQ